MIKINKLGSSLDIDIFFEDVNQLLELLLRGDPGSLKMIEKELNPVINSFVKHRFNIDIAKELEKKMSFE